LHGYTLFFRRCDFKTSFSPFLPFPRVEDFFVAALLRINLSLLVFPYDWLPVREISSFRDRISPLTSIIALDGSFYDIKV